VLPRVRTMFLPLATVYNTALNKTREYIGSPHFALLGVFFSEELDRRFKGSETSEVCRH